MRDTYKRRNASLLKIIAGLEEGDLADPNVVEVDEIDEAATVDIGEEDLNVEEDEDDFVDAEELDEDEDPFVEAEDENEDEDDFVEAEDEDEDDFVDAEDEDEDEDYEEDNPFLEEEGDSEIVAEDDSEDEDEGHIEAGDVEEEIDEVENELEARIKDMSKPVLAGKAKAKAKAKGGKCDEDEEECEEESKTKKKKSRKAYDISNSGPGGVPTTSKLVKTKVDATTMGKLRGLNEKTKIARLVKTLDGVAAGLEQKGNKRLAYLVDQVSDELEND